MTLQRELTWYERLKKNHLEPIADVISDNLTNIIAITTAIVAVGVAVKASNDADDTAKRNNDILESIENKLQTAIEVPTIVKVELGDDLEFIGLGNRTD